MSQRCDDCGRNDIPLNRSIQHLQICHACSAKRGRKLESCPMCASERVLAFESQGYTICSDCAGVPSPFACPECNREGYPYGRLCAHCTLKKRADLLLSDPETGSVHSRLLPLASAWSMAPNPATIIRWLAQTPPSTEILRGMARGEIPISHEAFDDVPPSKTLDYLRHLLTAVGVLEPWEPHIDRYSQWLKHELLPRVPADHINVIQRFGRWHILKGMQRHADKGTLTQAVANSARIRTRAAAEFCVTLAARGKGIEDATQSDLDEFIASAPGYNRAKTIASFVAWLRKARIHPRLQTSESPGGHATVTFQTEELWANVEKLLHDTLIDRATRIAGLFTLLFAQPLNRIVAMETGQVRITDTDVAVRFSETWIEMPPLVDTLLREHLDSRPITFPTQIHRAWLFPGSQPGQHCVTEVFRRDLKAAGIKPYEHRKTAMFHLASTMPSPLLSSLLGITEANAARWSALAGRSWTSYIGLRTKNN